MLSYWRSLYTKMYHRVFKRTLELLFYLAAVKKSNTFKIIGAFIIASGMLSSTAKVTQSLFCMINCQRYTIVVIYDNFPNTLAPLLHIHISHDGVIKWRHFPRYWPFVRGIHRFPVYSPHRINGWINNRQGGDFRRHRAHCDVIVMIYVHAHPPMVMVQHCPAWTAWNCFVFLKFIGVWETQLEYELVIFKLIPRIDI